MSKRGGHSRQFPWKEIHSASISQRPIEGRGEDGWVIGKAFPVTHPSRGFLLASAAWELNYTRSGHRQKGSKITCYHCGGPPFGVHLSHLQHPSHLQHLACVCKTSGRRYMTSPHSNRSKVADGVCRRGSSPSFFASRSEVSIVYATVSKVVCAESRQQLPMASDRKHCSIVHRIQPGAYQLICSAHRK